MPGRFVIDRKGIIPHEDINPDYMVRPDLAETVAVLKTLK